MSARRHVGLADLTATPPAQPAAAAPESPELVYLSARVPKTLRTELQLLAVRQGRPLAQLVQDAARLYLESQR